MEERSFVKKKVPSGNRGMDGPYRDDQYTGRDIHDRDRCVRGSIKNLKYLTLLYRII